MKRNTFYFTILNIICLIILFSAISCTTDQASQELDNSNIALDPPLNLTASNGIYDNKVLISWDSVTSAERYFIYRAKLPEGPYTEIGTTTSENTNYEDTSNSRNNLLL